MADDVRISTYAQSLFAIAQAEGNLAEVEDELFRFSQAFQTSDELRTTLTNASLPSSRRQQVVEELLGGRVSAQTVSIVSLIVGNGRARDLPAIVKEMVGMSAQAQRKAVAEVRSAIPLDDDQTKRLAAALNKATGREVEVKVIIDPTVMGGLLTQIDDTVIDGTVRSKLAKLRESMA